MKIWNGYGSEHSMNLVMIGQFVSADEASKAKEAIDKFKEWVDAEIEAKSIELGNPPTRYSNKILDFLKDQHEYHIGLAELEQFAYDVHVEVDKDKVVLKTDEPDISAFLKVLLDHGARIELYSAHDYPETSDNRDEKVE